jgi:hypothetical protein
LNGQIRVMNDYRERLERAELLTAFERARDAKNLGAMERVLREAQFSALDIESILWSKGGNVARAPTPEDKKRNLWDAVIGSLGAALISGVILGGVFVSTSIGGSEPGDDTTDTMMKDYRSPKEAYYRPFMWGFSIGAVVGLVTGAMAYEPKSGRID